MVNGDAKVTLAAMLKAADRGTAAMRKAWIAQAASGEAGAADEARAALARLERHYLSHPVAGGWYDQFDSDGNSLIDTIPASSFYHVLCAVTEAEQVLS